MTGANNLRWRPVALAAVFALVLPPSAGDESISAGEPSAVAEAAPGGGSYRLSRPQPCKPLPETIYVAEAVRGPIITNQWFSSLVWQPFSQNIFAHPLALRFSEKGLSLVYHGSRLRADKSGIFGVGPGPEGEMTIALAAPGDGGRQGGAVGTTAGATRGSVSGSSGAVQMGERFRDARCAGWSDWFVEAELSAGAAKLKASFGHGSPMVFCRAEGADPVISFGRVPKVFAGAAGASAVGFSLEDRHYALFAPGGGRIAPVEPQRWTIALPRGKDYFTVAALPDDRPETFALFARHAHNHVTDTRLEYRVEGGKLHSVYRFTVKQLEGRAPGAIFALYPHQWKYTTDRLTPLTYQSVRGLMKVGTGESFSTVVPIHGVLPFLPGEGLSAAERARLIELLGEEAALAPERFRDTYWEGKHLGRLATLAGSAEAVGQSELRQKFLGEIRRRLEHWFTAAPDKQQAVFYYDRRWGTLVGSPPSYGSDLPLNDHHFHYGYFIRAAAEAARDDPAWGRRWAPMVELAIRDIASTDRNDRMFPYLRCFDKYAGHSWASGDANFADGNNQESSSEALNAWYGMILWGAVMDKPEIRDAGLMLFNTERTAVEEYWFDVSGENYPPDFPQVALGMVWGGKGAFATWFSGDIDCIHGINWLPFTPASLYMGRHPDYVRKNFERIVAQRKGGTDFNTGWGDLVLMFGALADPAAAAARYAEQPQLKIEAGNSRAFLHHWICTLKNLGRIDASVSADQPLFAAFVRDGRRTLAAYNASQKPLTTTFAVEGRTLQAVPVPPRSMRVVSPR